MKRENEFRRNEFRKKVDQELEGIRLSEEALERIRREVRKPGAKIRRLLEKEITIPLRPLAAAVLITVTGIVYLGSAAIRITEEDVRKSRITVIEEFKEARENALYKN